FFFSLYVALLDLHSFPTRRSSDLTTNDFVLLLDKTFQYKYFIFRKLYRTGFIGNGVFLIIDRCTTPCSYKNWLIVIMINSTKHRLNLRDKHIKMKGLLNKVISTELHRHYHIGRVISRGQE